MIGSCVNYNPDVTLYLMSIKEDNARINLDTIPYIIKNVRMAFYKGDHENMNFNLVY